MNITKLILLVADNNECSENTHNCSTNGFCNNTDGSFTFTCSIGYSGDGQNCTGILVHFIVKIELTVVLRHKRVF